jgi:fido (protein-threonine AMPylation protein)
MFLRDLHHRMFGEVWTWAGKLRQRETTIGIAPAQIQERLQALLGDALYWIENETYDRSEIGVCDSTIRPARGRRRCEH